MTVFLRAATSSIGDTVTRDIPTLARLTREIAERGSADPFAVDEPTYAAAELEMLNIRKGRGYDKLPVAAIPQRNFLLFGVPIICEDT